MGFGGASYSGKYFSDAKSYIDKSQGRKGFSFSNPGHPRNHCANRKADSNTPCVENYSKGGIKTGFLDSCDQDIIGHYVLTHPRVQKELNILNQYTKGTGRKYIRRTITLSANELNLPQKFKGGTWVNGRLISISDIVSVTIVLQHYDGEENNELAPVHILTFYPRLADIDDVEECTNFGGPHGPPPPTASAVAYLRRTKRPEILARNSLRRVNQMVELDSADSADSDDSDDYKSKFTRFDRSSIATKFGESSTASSKPYKNDLIKSEADVILVDDAQHLDPLDSPESIRQMHLPLGTNASPTWLDKTIDFTVIVCGIIFLVLSAVLEEGK